jgi:hypothetical protein
MPLGPRRLARKKRRSAIGGRHRRWGWGLVAEAAGSVAPVLLVVLALGCDEPRSAPPSRPTVSSPAQPLPAAPTGPAAATGSAPPGVATTAAATMDAGADAASPSGEEGAACAPRDPKLKPLQLLRFTFTSSVEGKAPVDKLQIARPGQRVWAHLILRNRSGEDRCVHLIFRVDGQLRTEVDLDVGESWSWRTWAYATLRPTDSSGQLELEAIDDQSRVLAREHLPIVAAAKR